jgi:PASTA domain
MTHDDFDAFAPTPRPRPGPPQSDSPTLAFDRPDYDGPVRAGTRQYAGEHGAGYDRGDPPPPRRRGRGRHWALVVAVVVLALVGTTGVMLVMGGIGADTPKAADTAGGLAASSPGGPGASFPVSGATTNAPAPAPPTAPRGVPGASNNPTGAPAPGGGGRPSAGATAPGGGPARQFPRPTGRQRVIPNVVGMPLNDALRTLRQAGFRAGALYIAVNNPEQVGRVLRQSPDAGAPLDRGLGVTVLAGASGRR